MARPHHLAWTDEPVTLDGSRSRPAIKDYQWFFSDGTTASGPRPVRRYPHSGMYSEILKVTDAAGRVDYDFAVVQVMDRDHPKLVLPSIHAAYWPTLGLKPGDEVTFKVRTFRIGAAGAGALGFRRQQPGGGSAVGRQCRAGGQERLCGHHPPLREAGTLPGFGHAEQRSRPGGHGAVACGSGQ